MVNKYNIRLVSCTDAEINASNQIFGENVLIHNTTDDSFRWGNGKDKAKDLPVWKDGGSGGSDDPIPKGTPIDIMSFDENGNLKAERINAWHLTDVGGKPNFPLGALCGASLQSDNPLLLFRETSSEPKAGILPLYHESGRLKVGNAFDQDDAVNLSQLPKATNNLPARTGVPYSGGSVEYSRSDHTHELGEPTRTVRGGVYRQADIPDLTGEFPVDPEDINNILKALRGAGIL